MFQSILKIHTKSRIIVDITDQINDIIYGNKYSVGLCNLFIQHTSASLITCENADPTVRQDLENFITKLVPDGDPMFQHNAEGPDDMPAHIRSILTQTSLSIPIQNNQLALGTWQGIYLWEHRTRSLQRSILVTLL